MSIEKRKNGYRVKVWFGGKNVANKTFTRKREAEAWERAAKDALAAGKPTPGVYRGGLVTTDDYLRAWQDGKAGARASIADRATSAAHVSKAFGKRPVLTLSHSEIAKWAKEKAEVSPSVARRALAAFRGALALAVRDGITETNAALDIKLPSVRPGAPVALTHEEAARLAAEMHTQRDVLMVRVACSTGLRWGELTGLHVKSLLPDNSLLIEEAWTDVKGVLELGPVKTRASMRRVPLPRSVAIDLREFAKDRPEDELIFHGVLPTTPVRNNLWTRRVLAPALERAGITKHVTPHAFRDTFATLALAGGAPVHDVARVLGHADPALILRHYAYSDDAATARIAELFDEVPASEASNGRTTPSLPTTE